MSGQRNCPVCGAAVSVSTTPGKVARCSSCGADAGVKANPRKSAPRTEGGRPDHPRKKRRRSKAARQYPTQSLIIAGSAVAVLVVALVVGLIVWFWPKGGQEAGSGKQQAGAAGNLADGAGALAGAASTPYAPIP